MLPVLFLFLIPCAQLPLELGIIDVSAVSVTNGVLSVLAVLPAAAMASFLFRLPGIKLKGSGDDPAKEGKGEKGFCKGEFYK